jgi:hypothetical protein
MWPLKRRAMGARNRSGQDGKKKVALDWANEMGSMSAPTGNTAAAPYPLFGHRRRNASRPTRLDLSYASGEDLSPKGRTP